MNPYKELIHGGDLASCRNHPRLDFSANISPLGLPEGVREALRRSVEASVHYPDTLCRELRRALSGLEGVPAEWILCGAGAADLIFRLAYALRPPVALLLCPTFAEYSLALEQVDCDVRHYRLDPERNFAVGPDILEQLPRGGLVLLCNPNNPTGALCEPALLRRILEACRERGTTLAVDECFMELVDDPGTHSLKGELASADQLVLLRALTKSHAVPGLRLGYALSANGLLLGAMDRAGPAWNVSVPAQQAGIAAAGETDYLRRVRKLVRREREPLALGLEALGLRVFPGTANFLLFAGGGADLALRLSEKGILIRDCSNFRGLGPGYYRVAVRTGEDNRALLAAIEKELDEGI